MAGVKGRSGRRPVYADQLQKALKQIDYFLPDMMQKVVEKAMQGDKDCLIYAIDRRMGRPRQEIDARIKSVISFTPDDYELMGRARTHEIAVEPVPLLTQAVNNTNNEVLADITLEQAQTNTT